MAKLVSIFLPIIVLISIWVPVLKHYYVITDRIDSNIIKKSRVMPSNELLDEIQLNLISAGPRFQNRELIKAADSIIMGHLSLPRYPSVLIKKEVDLKNVEGKAPSFQLIFSSMKVSEILIDAYVLSGDGKYFDEAYKRVMQWALLEKKAWLPKGFLWNDHAIAARIFVLTKFWYIYRSHESFREEDARRLLNFVARSAQLLSKKGHFTFSTNHGVIQNFALLHVALAFPALQNIEEYKKIAIGRLKEQLSFYISDEGVVLEHSAGYHEFGMLLLGEIIRYMKLLGIRVDENWLTKYQKAKKFYATIRRPDGTLPMYGNTANEVRKPIFFSNIEEHSKVSSAEKKLHWRPVAEKYITPASGYSIWWEGLPNWPNFKELSQTVTVWSNYEGHGHKHADEMSVLLWAKGQTWWTNVGYWPYGNLLQKDAIGWSGSNAPHIVGEDYAPDRITSLLSTGTEDGINYLDLKREREDGYAVRRQVLYAGNQLWVIIDYAEDKQKRNSRQIWTTFPNILVRQDEHTDNFSLYSKDVDTTMGVSFIGSNRKKVIQTRGSIYPFSGWVVLKDGITQSSSFITDMKAGTWSACIWKIEDGDKKKIFRSTPTMNRWLKPEDWRMSISLSEKNISITRKDNIITVSENTGVDKTSVSLIEKSPTVVQEQQSIHNSFLAAALKYKKFKDYFRYRVKVSGYLIVLFIMQEISFFLLNMYARWPIRLLRNIASIAWLSSGIWLYFVYFTG
jgi:hypothetical protein